MYPDFWTISGWVIALLSLIVNFLQLLKNNELKHQIINPSQKAGKKSNLNQQSHSGHGDNININGNVDIKNDKPNS